LLGVVATTRDRRIGGKPGDLQVVRGGQFSAVAVPEVFFSRLDDGGEFLALAGRAGAAARQLLRGRAAAAPCQLLQGLAEAAVYSTPRPALG
jgi:hypothetical protein